MAADSCEVSLVRAIGRALNRSGRRMLIVQCDAAQLPRLYSEVVDRRMKTVGKIMDVFGKVSSPYAVVLCRSQCETVVGEKLFTR